MRETRVNLKHLLEDIRDSYTITLEEIILLELIANALDSGANRISFYIKPSNNALTTVDNGRGMRRKELIDYHNIAATTKIKGKGIGFAGIGAKLSLLLAEKVLTETRAGYGTRCATEWFLKSETSAPWKFVSFSGKVASSRGSAVTILFKNSDSLLLSQDFIIKTIHNHFYPLFHQDLFEPILKYVYKKGVEFFVNDKKIFFENSTVFNPKTFQIRLTGRGRQLVGTGFLAEAKNDQNIMFPGLGVSTYGKVIKSGWEWIGVSPKEGSRIYGIVEIPSLSRILTTNKMDFLKDAASLKKYYQYRKAIQEAVMPFLKEFGEELNLASQQKQYRSLSKEIERTLRNILKDFPELTPLLGIKKISQKYSGFGDTAKAQLVSIVETGLLESTKIDENENKETDVKNEPSQQEPKKMLSSVSKGKKSPFLIIGFENRGLKDPLARMLENKILINNSHPAYLRAVREKLDQYHIIFCVALTLSGFLEDKHSPQDFINNFLVAWAKDTKKPQPLFKIS